MLNNPSLRLAAFSIAATISLAFACQSAAPPEILAERVVMVSYDSLGADLAWRWAADPEIVSSEGLAGIARNGLSAERVRMIDPTLTAVSHLSLATGHNAAAMGVVGNAFKRPEIPITEWISGFNASSETDTLWSAARRKGLRVATLAWPGADAGAVDRMGDFGVTWPGPPLAPSEVFELLPETAETTAEVPSNDGLPPLLWRLAVDFRSATPSHQELVLGFRVLPR